jgi:predicted TIM-barrel fold metal-dependent hydrolase
MIRGRPVIDADSHKCENPIVFFDYIPEPFRQRVSLIRDRYGEQRFRFLDRNPATGANDLPRVFLQPTGYGKGTYRPYHEETTIGGLFNRVRLAHMEREGIDHQVIYGSMALSFNSLIDPELAVVLCRAYNDYIHEDCRAAADRLHPVAALPLQDPAEAVREMRRCVEELGMPGATCAPNLPQPHPEAPDRFPEIRVPRPLSHPDFHPIYAEAQRLGIALGIHGAPGLQLAAGTADQLDTFTLVHVFANRSMQQMALAQLVFDGVMEAFPKLRFGFLEAGAGWLPDFMYSLHEHWVKRIVRFDPSVQPGIPEILLEFARERNASGNLGEVGQRVCGMAVDYGHWDATLKDCVGLVADRPGIEPDHAVRLLSTNALDFYGERLRERLRRGSDGA